jgi:transcriptional regulator with XRE-family HTH domain
VIQISRIAIILGQRIRNFRMQQGLSQEKLAELAGVHPTYIGQIERGEKNITVESLEKVAAALRAPLWKIFEKIGPEAAEDDYPLAAYDLFAAQNIKEQKRLLGLLQEIIAYKNS